MPTIIWFRRDLRLSDNPALAAACARGAVIPLCILDPDEPIGGAGRWWLHESLAALGRACAALGAPLVLRRGNPQAVLDQVIAETGADAVHWSRCYEPYAIARDTAIKQRLAARGLKVRSFSGALLTEPAAISSLSGAPYRVFTPFWKTVIGHAPFDHPLAAPVALDAPSAVIASDALDDWALQPRQPDWASGLRATWVAGEEAAQRRLKDFLDVDVIDYKTRRDALAEQGASRLAPHLHWGEVSPRQVWAASALRASLAPACADGVHAFQRQLVWREFSMHLLFHWPDLVSRAWNPSYRHFPFVNSDAHFEAWAAGATGYPVVDAAMKCLWATGAMHNRARMITASFLIKHLLVDWRRGAEWFEDTLVDADLANNRAGWQWVAGSGADAAPYFRIFNPVLQGEKFDPDGAFIRAWLPQLAGLDRRFIHKPWAAPAQALADAGLVLGEHYPLPIIDHDVARRNALDALAEMKRQPTDV